MEKETWISVKNPPSERGRYWCYCREVNDLGISYFQWNCCYDEKENTWSDNLKNIDVTHWTNLLPPPTKI